ncbi:cilia- and flagella-associated protein 298 [Hydra vulgaris]|uniref:Uncharacterized protein C21orf59 n=1 Tax=Hydra vulgaris TaxID=6087 RepID=T2MEI8_HYDVU|nr:cilia- and flagella-associated protein 298 [Hydra vulgaris]
MVKLHVKRGDESQFIFETTVKEQVDVVIEELLKIYNGRLKIDRLFHEMESLELHGIMLPSNMQGLTEEQISELKLQDSWSKSCYPQGGSVFNKDPIGRRNGVSPNAKMADVIKRTRHDAKAQVSKDLVKADKSLTYADVKNALDKMRGAIMIVYPMGLPPYDPIKMELDGNEDLSGTQALKEVLDSDSTLWWAGKELQRGKKLEDFIGKNEKTKVVVKLQKKSQNAPSREPIISEEEQKAMMAYYYRRQEEIKKLEQDEFDSYLNSPWSDSSHLKRQFQGLNNISWKPK